MKKTSFFVLMMCICLPGMTQLAIYSPVNSDFEHEITITIDLNFAEGPKVKGLLGKSSDVYLWAGAGSAKNSFEFQPPDQTNWNFPNAKGKMKNIGTNRWEITLNPREYFHVPSGKSIVILGMLIKTGDGSFQTENITLKMASNNQLTDVVVKDQKPFIEQQLDKTILNIQNDLTSLGLSVFQILQNAPGVTVTIEDQITLAGKGNAAIWVDGRLSQITRQDLINYLKATPGSEIEKIEIISNPSSKFDAQGSGGIINIKFKKNKKLGTNGNVTLNYVQGIHQKANGSFSLNNSSKGVNLFANYSFTEGEYSSQTNIYRLYSTPGVTKSFDNYTYTGEKWTGNNFRTGMDIFLNKKSTLGILITGNMYHSVFRIPGNTYIRNPAAHIDSSLATAYRDDYDHNHFDYNVNYTYEDTSGTELVLNAIYTDFRIKDPASIQTRLFDQNNSQYGVYDKTLNTNSNIGIFIARGDFTKRFKKQNAKIEAGVKFSFLNTDNTMLSLEMRNNTTHIDSEDSRHFNYKETIKAGYVNFNQQLGRFEYQVGVRAEHIAIKGIATDMADSKRIFPDTAYANLFPTLYLSYKVSDKERFVYSFNRRINRPNYQELNPFTEFIDLYTEKDDNPYLLPEFQDNHEIKFIYKNSATIGTGYSLTKNAIQTIIFLEGQVGVAKPENLDSKESYYLYLSVPIRINKWWNVNTNFNIYANRFSALLPQGKLNTESWGNNGYISNNFNLPNKVRVQLNFSFAHPGIEGYTHAVPYSKFDFGIQKDILNNLIGLRLGVADIFNTLQQRSYGSFAETNYDVRRKGETRTITFGLAWRFGNKNITTIKERKKIEENNRIKDKTN
jgi:iron complex outermembrane receptor protein